MIKDGNGWRMTTPYEDRLAYERFDRMVTMGVLEAFGLRKYLEAHVSIVGPSYEFKYKDEWLKLHPEDKAIYDEVYAAAEKKALSLNRKYKRKPDQYN